MPTKEHTCRKHGLGKHYWDSWNERWSCSACNVLRVSKRRKDLKVKAVEYKGGKCSRCGYSRCISAIEFHHTDPTKKDFALANKGETRGWDVVQAELDKCEIVCANCHREIHSGMAD